MKYKASFSNTFRSALGLVCCLINSLDFELLAQSNPPSYVVGNLVFRDNNRNGKFDLGDQGIDGVTIRLIKDANSNGGQEPEEMDGAVQVTTSDGGRYRFENVTPGQYWVWIPQSNLMAGNALDRHISTEPTGHNANDGFDGDDNGIQWWWWIHGVLCNRFEVGPFSMPVAEDGDANTNLTIDFGFVPASPLSVGNQVFQDTNKNGRLDPGEPGIDQVPLVLIRDVNNNGSIEPEEEGGVASTTTSNGGKYLFEANQPGRYWIAIPSTAFSQGGVLHGKSRSSYVGDSNSGMDGDNNAHNGFGIFGAVSGAFDLFHGLEPLIEDRDSNTDLTIDLGFRDAPTLSVGDQVFLDVNSNGRFDDADSGIADVELILMRDANSNWNVETEEFNTRMTVRTDVRGKYRFENLESGRYWVGITSANYQPNGPLHGKALTLPGADQNSDIDGDNNGRPWSSDVPVVTGIIELFQGNEPVSEDGEFNSNLTIDIGFNAASTLTIGNRVFHDSNLNGRFDDGDPGIPNVAMGLITDSNANGGIDQDEVNAARSMFTDAQGFYRFEGLAPGFHWVYIDSSAFGPGGPLDGFLSLEPTADPNNATDHDDNASAYSNQFLSTPALTGTELRYELETLFEDGDPQTDLTIDFGFRQGQRMAIGNQVFHDANRNGIFDSGDTGISGVVVQLGSDADQDGNVSEAELSTGSQVTTDQGGFYRFSIPSPGLYRVGIPSGNFDVGGALSGMGATLVSPHDVNDGIDGDNTGIPWLTPLSTGNIDMRVGAQPAAEDGDPNTDLTVDFGFITLGNLKIGNLIFKDLNRNGKFDSGDEAAGGVEVQLVRDRDNNGQFSSDDLPPLKTTTTSDSGHYIFDEISENGTYFVRIPQEAFAVGGGLNAFGPTLNSGGNTHYGIDQDNNGLLQFDGSLVTSGFSVNARQMVVSEDGNPNTDLTIDIGIAPTGPLSIGNLVFKDNNKNGIREPSESGIAGVQIRLLQDVNLNHQVDEAEVQNAQVTTTDANGNYLFSGLAAGSYFVEVTALNFSPNAPLANLISSKVDGTPHSGTDNDDNGWPSGVPFGVMTGRFEINRFGSPTIEDGDSNSNLTIDFGFIEARPMEIGNLVFRDDNNNGRMDSGEGGINGVSLKLVLDANNNGGIDVEELENSSVAVTAGGGLYSFSGVSSGFYFVLIPASNFADEGPLAGLVPSDFSQNVDQTIDGDNNGYNHDGGALSNGRIHMFPGSQPYHEDGDFNSNLTVDFGFRPSGGTAPKIVQQPASVTADEHSDVSFAVTVRGISPIGYQWYRNNEPISGANYPTYSIRDIALSDTGSEFFVRVSSNGANVDSDTVTLTVTADATPLSLIGADAVPNLNRVILRFSEVVDVESVTTIENYSISGGETVISAQISVDGRRVVLHTSDLTPGQNYTVTVSGLEDTATPPNIITANSQASFTAFAVQQGGLALEFFPHTTADAGTLGYGTANFPAIPDESRFVTGFDSILAYPDGSRESYSARMFGWIVPKETGQYRFFVRSDDQSELFLSSDEDSANAVRIALEDGCCGNFEEPGAAETSAPITLVQGQRYYIEGRWSEGGGGDYIKVAWRKEGDSTATSELLPIAGDVLEGLRKASETSPTMTIGNKVFADSNGNGFRDANELGIAGIQLVLYHDVNNSGALDENETNAVASTQTNADGEYSFTITTQGNYLVAVAASNFGPGQALSYAVTTEPTSGDPQDGNDEDDNGYETSGAGSEVRSNLIRASLGGMYSFEDGDPNSNLTVDFGFRLYQPLSVGNQVFRDANSNGLFDAGDDGIDGVVVNLLRDLNQDGGMNQEEQTPVQSVTTSNGGKYLFSGVAPGFYWIQIPKSNFSGQGALTGMVTTDPTIHVGQRVDGDDNGYFNGSLGSMTSRFDLSVRNEPVYEDGDPNTNLTIDFGFRQARSLAIGNLVFRDTNNNGIFEPEAGETGIDGVVVNLLLDADNNWWQEHEFANPVATTTTSNGGKYEFTNLAEGLYIVDIAASNFAPIGPLARFASSLDNWAGPMSNNIDGDDNGALAGSPRGVSCEPFWLVLGSNPIHEDNDPNTNLTVDFGFRQVNAHSVGDLVFLDSNDNGIRDGDEAGIDGVTVRLIQDADLDGGFNDTERDQARSTTTSEGGKYIFTDLPEGNYWVWIPRSNFLQGGGLQYMLSSRVAFNVGNDIDDDNNGRRWGGEGALSGRFTLRPGNNPVIEDGDSNTRFTVDFGFRQLQSLSVGNRVFKDVNRNGLFDVGIDQGIAGVSLNLLSDPNYQYHPGTEGVSVVATTTTDEAGLYRFSGLNPGGYLVQIPASNFSPGGPLHLQAPTSRHYWSGNYHPLDSDINAFSSGLGAWSHRFEINLWAQPRTEDNDPNTDFTVSLGFRAVQPLTVGNHVFHDSNNNGIFDTDESGIGAVQMRLVFDANVNGGPDQEEVDASLSTFTSNDGAYSFSDLAPGRYWVLVPAVNFAQGAPLYRLSPSSLRQTDGNHPSDYINKGYPWGSGVLSGTFDLQSANQPITDDGDPNTRLTIDFGFRSGSSLSIGNLVFLDQNGNGRRDSTAEPGIAGVLVRLLRDSNANGQIDEAEQLDPIATTLTDLNGNYTFADLENAYYAVDVSRSNFETGKPLINLVATSPYFHPFNGDSLNTGHHPWSRILGVVSNFGINFLAGEGPEFEDGDPNTYFTVDFGFRPVSSLSIGNVIFNDLNRNGVSDADEPGIADVALRLVIDTNDNGHPDDNEIAAAVETRSDQLGNYRFENLVPGRYWVFVPRAEFLAEGKLSSFVSSEPTSGVNFYFDSVDIGYLWRSDVGVFSNWYVDVNYGVGPIIDDGDPNTYFNLDFGFVSSGSLTIGDRVFADLNSNGVFEEHAGEGGIANVTVKLIRDENGNGGLDGNERDRAIATVTDEQGKYAFTNLTPRIGYWIWIPENNFLPTKPLDGWTVAFSVQNAANRIDHDNNAASGAPWNVSGFLSGRLDIDLASQTLLEDGDPNTDLTIDFGFVPDRVPVKLISALRINPTLVQLTFNKTISAEGAGVRNKFSIDSGVTVVSSAISPIPHIVLLQTSPLAEDVTYNLTATSVEDRSVPANVLATTTLPIKSNQGVISEMVYRNTGTSRVQDLLNQPSFPNVPDTVRYPNRMEIRDGASGDNVGARLVGWITPPVDGEYTFYLSANETARLSLSTDGNPANAAVIAEVSGGMKPRAWLDGAEVVENSVVFRPDTLFIEAEDVDFGGGKFVTEGSIGMTGSYSGGAYQGLGTDSDAGIDWFSPGGSAGNPYRASTGIAAGKPGNSGIGFDRGAFQVIVNHVVGWNDVGDWYNYTRDFPEPAREYHVFGRLSSGGEPINAKLDRVSDGAGTATQSLSGLGEFESPATAGYDVFRFVPLKTADGSMARVNLGGRQTLRATTLPGNHDADYYAFVPAGTSPPVLRKENISQTVRLEAGKRYFIEAVMADQAGPDHLAVAWRIPGGAEIQNGDEPISGEFLDSLQTSGAVQIVQDPRNATGVEGFSARFKLGVQGTPPFVVDWYKNDVLIPDEHGLELDLPNLASADHGAVIKATVRNSFSSDPSAQVVLSVLSASDEIVFADQKLETVVRQQLNKPSGAITSGDMKSIIELHAFYRGIANLGGLEAATNLRVLFLDGNPISNLNPILGLGSLTQLGLRNTQIANIPVPNAWNRLTGLFLDNTPLTSIEFLRQLVSIEDLGLSDYADVSSFKDFTPIQSLSNIRTLTLDGRPITGIEFIGGKPQLWYLSLNDTPLTQLPDLSARFPLLSQLRLANTYLNSLDFVSNLPHLDVLDLDNWNRTMSFPSAELSSVIPGLTRLSELHISAHNLDSIQFLSQNSQLLMLVAEENRISDLTPLSNLQFLSHIQLRHNLITSIQPIQALSALGFLRITTNPLIPIPEQGGWSVVESLRNRGVYVESDQNPSVLVTLPTNNRLTSSTGLVPGFSGRIHHQPASDQENSLIRAERQLAGDFGGNLVVERFIEDRGINYQQEPLVLDRVRGGHNFPNVSGSQESLALAVEGYVELKAGRYLMGVTSDDGFAVTTPFEPVFSKSPLDGSYIVNPNATRIFQFDGGRDVGDSYAYVQVTEDGLYPLRLVWEEGAGNANLEWWIIDLGQPADAQKIVLIGSNDANSPRVYHVPSGLQSHPFVSLGSIHTQLAGSTVPSETPLVVIDSDIPMSRRHLDISINVSSSDPLVLPNSAISIVQDGFQSRLRILPQFAQHGVVNIAISVSDLDGFTSNLTFPLQFVAANNAIGYLKREFFSNIPGWLLSQFTSDPRFPNSPTQLDLVTEFEVPHDGSVFFGQKLSGYLLPPESGQYVFYVAADDETELYLSTDQNPAQKVLIAREPLWNSYRDYQSTVRRDPIAPENRSASIQLEAGRAYYIEALHKGGPGGNQISVAWQIPGGQPPQNGDAPIPGRFLSVGVPPVMPPAFALAPQNKSPIAGQPVSMTAIATGAQPLTYQWLRNGQPLAEGAGITGTKSPFLLINRFTSNLDGQYSVEVRNAAGTAISRAATVTAQVGEGLVVQPAGAEWQYTFEDPTSDPNWNVTTVSVGTWTFGNAPFGHTAESPVSTIWHSNGTSGDDLWIRRTLDLSGLDPSKVTYRLTVDNGYKLFVNGQLIASDNAEGGHSFWEYSGPLTGAFAGVNHIALALEDHGVPNYFDMEILADSVSPPRIITSPLAALKIVGEEAILQVAAAGSGQLLYEWRLNSEIIPNQTGPTLTIPAVKFDDAGFYSVRITNSEGSAETAPVMLAVRSGQRAELSSTGDAFELIVAPGLSWTNARLLSSSLVHHQAPGMLAVLDSAEKNAFVWNHILTLGRPNQYWLGGYQVSSNQWAWVDDSPWSFTNFEQNEPNGDSGWTAPLSIGRFLNDLWNDEGGTPAVHGFVAQFRGVDQRLTPTWLEDIPNQTITRFVNQGLSLSVVARGGRPLTYQWYKGEDPLPGQNATTLALSSLALTDSASYHVRVSNRDGQIQSGITILNVHEASGPAITFTIPNLVAGGGSTVIVPIKVADFVGISSAQFSMRWNPAIINFSSVSSPNIADLTSANFGTDKASEGILTVSWNDTTQIGATLDLNAVFCNLHFHVTGAMNSSTVISIADSPTRIEVADNELKLRPVELVNGSVTVPSTANVAGRVRYYSNSSSVPLVDVSVGGGASATATTGTGGTFAFTLNAGGDYTLTASRASDSPAAQGVSTLDITLIRRHILGILPLDTPYKLLAADVNDSATVSTLDITLIRRLILGITNNFVNGPWNFVPSDRTFENAASPWNVDRTRRYTPLSIDQVDQDILAIKKGDVNGSWTAPVAALPPSFESNNSGSRNPVSPTHGGLFGPVISRIKGAADTRVTIDFGGGVFRSSEIIKVPVRVRTNKKLTSLQFGLRWNSQILEMVDIGNFGLRGMGASNLNLERTSEGMIHVSWDDPMAEGFNSQDGNQIFEMSFRALKQGSSATAIGLFQSDVRTEASVDFEPAPVEQNLGWIWIGRTPRTDLLFSTLSGSTSLQLEIPTWTGLSTQIEAATDLGAGDWRIVSTEPGTGSAYFLAVLPEGNRQQYFRVRYLPGLD